MTFKISGQIREKESGLGVKGLMVRAYDKDLFFDDLLGTAVTDREGHFDMIYSEQDFRELFEKKPDIYLSVYTPPFHQVMDTKDSIHWGASEEEQFELEIERESLGNLAPTLPDDQVQGKILAKKEQLQFEKREKFVIPKLPGFGVGSVAGAPALLEQIQYVALPLDGDVLDIEIHTGEPEVITNMEQPLPVQTPMPDLGTDAEQFGDGFSMANIQVSFTPPDEKIYEGVKPYPENLVELYHVEEIGSIQMAAVRVRPLQYNPNTKSYIFYPDLRYNLKFDLEKSQKRVTRKEKQKRKIGFHAAKMIDNLLHREFVIAAKDLHLPDILVMEEVPHIIITDNYAWPESIDNGDGTTRAPNLAERGSALPGDMIAEFERLAEWKTAKGVRSRVITISDIVDGEFGDFTEAGFTRDLQELVRNFIKYAKQQWDAVYVLLAGDVNVVPMRNLAGSSTYPTVGCYQSASNPPPEGTCHFISGKSVVKLRPKFTPSVNEPMSSLHQAIRIPFNREAGSGHLGWYYTNETEFLTRDEGFTRLPAGSVSSFIIVEGPESIIDDAYYWMRTANSIPSDMYYASLIGPGYSIPGKHDFDKNNNGIYGQFHYNEDSSQEETLDDIDFWSDVWVGRAPVETGEQAQAFVDKILTYERLETPDGMESIDPTYLQKVLYGSAYWGRQIQNRQMDTSTPPIEGRFSHESGTGISKVHTKFDIVLTDTTPSHRLIADHSTFDVPINYNFDATEAILGWYFTTDDTYTTKSATATRFVKVAGPEVDIDCSQFFWDPIGLELAAHEKETLRGMMDGLYPNFESIERHYADYYDLAAPPPLFPLESDTIRDALDNGVHFASLTGHGSWAGCCGVSIVARPDFANENKYFIMFADSCSTARPDGVDSLGEVSTLDPNGGAVAYVGNTRYSWISIGDNYEQFFWKKLSIFGQPGPAAGMRLATDGTRRIWTIYAQTLFGEPEMPVWTDNPNEHEVTHPESVNWGGSIIVTVRKLGTPVAGHRVTLLGGWTNSGTKPQVFLTKTTNSFGQASFNLPSGGSSLDDLKLTVTHANFKPYVGQIAIEV